MTEPRIDSGFTLMEALVGLLILTIGLTALYSAFSGGVEGLRRSERRELAVEIAQSILEETGVTAALVAGVREGRSPEGFPWRVEIRARPAPETSRTSPRVEGYWVDVVVADGPAMVHLKSLKVVQTP